MKISDESMSVGHSFGRLHDREEYGGWTDGEVLTPNGIVSVYAQGGDGIDKHTRLDFVLGGRLYIRRFHGKRYSHRGIVTIATRFSAEISNKENDHDRHP